MTSNSVHFGDTGKEELNMVSTSLFSCFSNSSLSKGHSIKIALSLNFL